MKVMAELLALLPRILECPKSYIGLESSYNKFIRGCSHLLEQIRKVTQIRPRLLPSTSFTSHNSLISPS